MEEVKVVAPKDVVVYSKPNCPQCTQTKNLMKSKGVDFVEVDITTDPESYTKILGLGYRQAPVVIAGNDHWSGFQPAKISSLAQ